MPSVPLRRLERGDEAVAKAACRRFGLRGDLDTRSFLSRPEATLMVIEVDGGVAGWVYGHELAHPGGERTMLLYALDVAAEHRGRGYGSALVEAFVSGARDRGCTEVWVLTEHDNDAGIATYASAGGTPDGGGRVMFTWKLAEGRHS
jgi:ribosomal protein S18 acetylase RimI-like enzyme